MTYAEYLAAEAVAGVRHEFLNGEVREMAGGTIEHGALALAVRVRIPETDLTTYPDLSIVCGQLETAPDDKDAITNPIVLVSQGEPRIEVQRRSPGGGWELLEARPGETIELASLGVRLDVAAVYANPLDEAARA